MPDISDESADEADEPENEASTSFSSVCRDVGGLRLTEVKRVVNTEIRDHGQF